MSNLRECCSIPTQYNCKCQEVLFLQKRLKSYPEFNALGSQLIDAALDWEYYSGSDMINISQEIELERKLVLAIQEFKEYRANSI